MKSNFSNRIVLITGASTGIGRELALNFAKQGAKLVLTARSLPQLEAVAQEALKLGSPDVLVVAGNITQKNDVDHLLAETKKRFGHLDILVNNAGKGLYGKWEDVPFESHENLFNLNYFSVVELTQKSIPLMRMGRASKNKKLIINIASIASFWPVPKMGSYCASKAAIHTFSSILRIELKKDKIGVLCVYPGVINTEFSANAPNPNQENVPEDYKTQGKGLSPQKLAVIILKAASRGKKREYVTFSNRLLIKFYQHIPSFFEWIMHRYAHS